MPWVTDLSSKQTCREAACSRCGGKQLSWELKAGMQGDTLCLIGQFPADALMERHQTYRNYSSCSLISTAHSSNLVYMHIYMFSACICIYIYITGRSFQYLAGLRRVYDVHSAWLNTIGFGPPVQGKSAFPSSPISVGQRAIVPVTEGVGGYPRLIFVYLENTTQLFF